MLYSVLLTGLMAIRPMTMPGPLSVAIMLYQLHQDEKILNLIQTYLAFLNHAIDPKSGEVRNRMSYEKRWSTKDNSEDSHGRTLWSLGYTILHAPNESILDFRACSSFRGFSSLTFGHGNNRSVKRGRGS